MKKAEKIATIKNEIRYMEDGIKYAHNTPEEKERMRIHMEHYKKMLAKLEKKEG